MSLPHEGHVLGIDVGYSKRRATTGLCLLSWTGNNVTWSCRNATSDLCSRQSHLSSLVDNAGPISAVAIDGPLRPNLEIQDTYRVCESLLSRGSFQKRGKPGPSSSPVGKRLHRESKTLAELAFKTCNVETATWQSRIHHKALVEAFPNLFLGVLCDEAMYPTHPTRKRRWTDSLFPLVRERCKLMLDAWFPDRQVEGDLNLNDHEQIAGLVCAFTALAAAAGDGVFVGSENDGDIILPPLRFWGKDRQNINAWAESVLIENLNRVRLQFPSARFVGLGSGN